MTEMNDAVAVGRPVAETKKRGGERKPSNGKGRRNLEIFILSAPAIILSTALSTFLTTAALAVAIRRIPVVGRWIIG